MPTSKTDPKGKGAYQVGEEFNPKRLFDGVFIPEAIVRYRSITPGAKLVWGRLCRYMGDNQTAWPKVDSIADEVGLSVRQTATYIKELSDNHFIKVTRRGLHLSNTYRFIWHPCLDGELGDLRSKRPENKTGGGTIDEIMDGGYNADLDMQFTADQEMQLTSDQDQQFTASQEGDSPYYIEESQLNESQEEESHALSSPNPHQEDPQYLHANEGFSELTQISSSDRNPSPTSPLSASDDTTCGESNDTTLVNQYGLVKILEAEKIKIPRNDKRAIQAHDGEWSESYIRQVAKDCNKQLWRILKELKIDTQKPRGSRRNNAGGVGGRETGNSATKRSGSFKRDSVPDDPRLQECIDKWNSEIPSRKCKTKIGNLDYAEEFFASFDLLIEEAKLRLERNPDDEWVNFPALLLDSKAGCKVWELWIQWRGDRQRKPPGRETGEPLSSGSALDAVLGKYNLK